MDKQNCPNCGAPIVNGKCNYCGAVFLDFANINVGDLTYLNIKIDGKIFFVKTRCDCVALKMEYETLPNLTMDFSVFEMYEECKDG